MNNSRAATFSSKVDVAPGLARQRRSPSLKTSGGRGTCPESVGMRPLSDAALKTRQSSLGLKGAWGALGTHDSEKRRLTLEDVGRRFRRSAAVFGNYLQGSETLESDVVIELELVGVWAQPDRVDLVGALEVDPGLDQVRGEYVALQQEVVIGLERVEHLVEAGWDGRQ